MLVIAILWYTLSHIIIIAMQCLKIFAKHDPSKYLFMLNNNMHIHIPKKAMYIFHVNVLLNGKLYVPTGSVLNENYEV